MKKIIIIASAIIALASCAKNELTNIASRVSEGEDIISFGNYAGRSITKAGKTGDMVLDSLKKADAGFGVYAYYTAEKDFNGTEASTNQNAAIAPNFMFNEKVYWDGTSAWTYDNLKYWPNDNENADGGNSTGSVASSKLSFFAYAPYVDETTTDFGTSGIIGFTDNAATQPKVTYQIDPAGLTVDLLWGTAGSNGNDVNGNAQPGARIEYTDKNSAAAITAYNMNVNLVKMEVDGKVQFAFKHALAQIGGSSTRTATVLTPTRNDDGTAKPSANDTTATLKQGGLQVKLNVDSINGGELDRNTIITVKNIIVTNDINGDGVIDASDAQDVTVPDPTDPTQTIVETRQAGFVSRGDFNIVTGEWIASTDPAYANGLIDMSVTSPAQNAEDAAAAAAATPPQTYTEPTIVMCKKIAEPADVTAISQLPMGVQVVPQNVYENGANPLVLMPGTVPVLKFTVTYIVRSVDTKLQKGYTEVEQTISKVVSFNNAIEMNKMYNIIIALGLTSVKFDALVSNWEGDAEPVATDPVTGDPIYGYDTTTTPATPITDPNDPRLDWNTTVHLPINVE